MRYVIYRTTNLLTGQYYIGAHRTRNLDDSYLGSGKLISLAITKHGKKNFKKEILDEAMSMAEMFELEKKYVTSDVVDDPNSYNMTIGGYGGCKIPKHRSSELGKINIKKVHEWNTANNHYDTLGKLNSQRIQGSTNTEHSLRMKKFHDENPQLWWNNGTSNKRSPKCPGEGWYRGRLNK